MSAELVALANVERRGGGSGGFGLDGIAGMLTAVFNFLSVVGWSVVCRSVVGWSVVGRSSISFDKNCSTTRLPGKDSKNRDSDSTRFCVFRVDVPVAV